MFFVLCSFPEDYNIKKRNLILLWIAEGFLAKFDYDIDEAHKEGEDIISNLMRACLLENGEIKNTIKMHDVTRDMALWVACNHGENTRYLVRDCSLTSGIEVYNDPKWKEAEKLSFWNSGNLATNFPQKPHCANLVTLHIRHTLINVFPTEVFVLTSTIIRVLDLSFNKDINKLPSEIGDFVNLEYMNLSSTNIEKLPEELKNLKKLRFLLLDGFKNLEIPKEVISGLLSLQAFSVTGHRRVIDENVWLHELEGLDHLQDIRITILSISSVTKILTSSKLQWCIREIYADLSSTISGDFISSLGKMEHIEVFYANCAGGIHEQLEAADIPRSSFRGHGHTVILRQLTLYECNTILDLNWLIHAPNLETLY